MANAGPKCNHRLATSLWMHCRQGTDGFPPPAQPFATHCIGGRNSHYTDTPNTFICYGILSWNTITLLCERYYIYADPYSSWASWKSLGLPAALLWIINQEGRLQQRLNVQCIQLNSDQLPSSRTVVEHAELLGQFIKPQGHPLTIHFETKCCSDVKLFQNNWLQLSTQRVNPDVEPAHEGYLPAGRRARWEMGKRCNKHLFVPKQPVVRVDFNLNSLRPNKARQRDRRQTTSSNYTDSTSAPSGV